MFFFCLTKIPSYPTLSLSLMTRRSPRKKAISPEAVVDSGDENFIAVASDDPYALQLVCSNLQSFLIFIFYSLDEDEEESLQDSHHGKKKKYGRFVPFVRKKSVPGQSIQSEEDEMYVALTLLPLCFLLQCLLPQYRDHPTPDTLFCQSSWWEETCNCHW